METDMTTYPYTNITAYAAKVTVLAASLAFGIPVAQGQVIDNFHGNTPATAHSYSSAPTLGRSIGERGARRLK
jgi:hypothetical protein